MRELLSRLYYGLLVALIPLLLLSGVVLAIGNPDSVTIESQAVYEGVLEVGDQLYFVSYNVGYTPVPPEDPSTTWQIALYEETSGDLVKTAHLHYYGRNVSSIYLSAVNALSSEGEHALRVMGMPSVFGSLVEGTNMRTYSLVPVDWYSGSALGDDMLEQAALLEVALNQTLLTDGGYLNAAGTTYFLAAIPKLETMEPGIFEYATASVDFPGMIDWDTNYTDATVNKTGSRLRNAINGTASIFGVSSEGWGGTWLFSMLFVLLAAPVYAATKNPYWAFVVGFPLFLGGAWIGIGTAEMFRGLLILVLVLGVGFALVFWLRHMG